MVNGSELKRPDNDVKKVGSHLLSTPSDEIVDIGISKKSLNCNLQRENQNIVTKTEFLSRPHLPNSESADVKRCITT